MIATPTNTAAVCVRMYPPDARPPSLDLFHRSAVKHGVSPVYFGDGLPFSTWYDAKVVRLRGWIDSLPTEVEHILYVDCLDCLFAQPFVEILRKYNERPHPIILAADPVAFPVNDPLFTADFPKLANGFNYPCAGMWIGRRPTVMTALRLMQSAHDNPRQVWNPEHLDNDQYLWQLAYLYPGMKIRVDNQMRLFINPWLVPPEQFGETANDVRLTNGSTPGVLHFPGHNWNSMNAFAAKYNLV